MKNEKYAESSATKEQLHVVSYYPTENKKPCKKEKAVIVHYMARLAQPSYGHNGHPDTNLTKVMIHLLGKWDRVDVWETRWEPNERAISLSATVRPH